MGLLDLFHRLELYYSQDLQCDDLIFLEFWEVSDLYDFTWIYL